MRGCFCQDNEALEDDGTELMPFNLEEERKESYFDKTGNYVEYVNKDIKDAWLESIADQPILAQKHSVVTNDIVEAADLTSQDIGSIKTRIVDALEPGVTDNEPLEDDGTELMPFNLEEERKEGYFDQTGNYVEYVNKDIKDAWLESIADQPILAQKHSVVTNDIVEAADLTSQDIGSIKTRIVDALEPGVTDNEPLEDDGTELMPSNLEEERKEGYFDQTGNYVEYVNKDIKDAWLESIADQPILAQKHSVVTNDIVQAANLTSSNI